MNLFLTEEGVLKLGTYGLTTQAECYSIKRDCNGIRILDLEVHERKSAVWSFETALIEVTDITSCIGHEMTAYPHWMSLLSSHSGCVTSNQEIQLGRSTTCP